jgi:hypothetical protein
MKLKLIQLILILIPTIASSQINSSVDFIFGIESSYRTLKTSSDEAIVHTILQGRESRELSKLNWRLGFNYNKRLSSKFVLKSGLRLASVGYKDAKQIDLRWPSEISPNGYMKDPSLPHELQLVSDYLFVEIPLAARFEFNNKKVSPFLEMGVAPSIYITTKIKQITDLDTKSTYQRGGTSDYNNMHLVGFTAFGVNYLLNEKFQLFGQGIVRYHFTKLYNAPIEEHLYSYGIEMGVRRRLN